MNHSEKAYLEKLVQRLNATAGMRMVRKATYTPLSLLTAYTQLTLRSAPPESSPVPSAQTERDDERAEFAPPPSNRISRTLAGRSASSLGASPFRPRRKRGRLRQIVDGATWVVVQVALLVPFVLVVQFYLPAGSFALAWANGGMALLALLLWFGLALVAHGTLARLRDYLDSRTVCTAPPDSPGAAIWNHPQLLIQGHPGSGKTSLLRHIAVVCAQAQRPFAKRGRVRMLYGWPTHPFPIYLPLNALTSDLFSLNCPLLVSCVHALKAFYGLELSDDFFQKRAERGGCIILIDSFDELADPETRIEVGRLVVALAAINTRNRIVVTSRIEGYEGQLDGVFTRRYLADLTAEQTATFVQARYYALLETTMEGSKDALANEARQQATHVLAHLADHPGLTLMGRNPFLLSLIVAVHNDNLSDLPRQRNELYACAVELLVDEWAARKRGEVGQRQPPRVSRTAPEHDLAYEPTISLNKEQKLSLLSEIAWRMYDQSSTSDREQSHTTILRSNVYAIIATTLRTFSAITADRAPDAITELCAAEARRWLTYFVQRSGILYELGNVPRTREGIITFAHLTFQEYLAAGALQTGSRTLSEKWNAGEQTPDERVDAAVLRDLLTTAFNMSELQTLCFDLGIDYECLPGRGKADMPRELVAYVKRTGQTTELLTRCRSLRPHIDWPATRAPLERERVPKTPAARRAHLLTYWADPRLREVLLLYSAACPDASPVVRHLLDQQQMNADLLAGAVLVEQPVALEPALHSETVARLRRLILDTPTAALESILKALKLAADGADEVRGTLVAAAVEGAPLVPVRVRAIELLAGTEPNRPAPNAQPTPVQAQLLRVLADTQVPPIRIAAGYALARHDPRYQAGTLPTMIKISAGPFLLGSSAEELATVFGKEANPRGRQETPNQHQLTLPDYWIGETPITNAQFRPFVEGDGYRNNAYWTKAGLKWRNERKRRQPAYWDDPQWNGDNQPVVGVTWYEAVAYCRWLSAQSGDAYRLPTEAEWEKAARGPAGLIWPWGDTWQEGCCNCEEAKIQCTTPVGSYPNGASHYGVLDMAGNVWEWCSSSFKHYPAGSAVAQKDFTVDEWDAPIRGGSWRHNRTYVRCGARGRDNPIDRFNVWGFRVVWSPRSH